MEEMKKVWRTRFDGENLEELSHVRSLEVPDLRTAWSKAIACRIESALPIGELIDLYEGPYGSFMTHPYRLLAESYIRKDQKNMATDSERFYFIGSQYDAQWAPWNRSGKIPVRSTPWDVPNTAYD